MSHQLWQTVVHGAAHDDSKVASVVLIIAGVFLAPFLIGIPMILVGLYRLGK